MRPTGGHARGALQHQKNRFCSTTSLTNTQIRAARTTPPVRLGLPNGSNLSAQPLRADELHRACSAGTSRRVGPARTSCACRRRPALSSGRAAGGVNGQGQPQRRLVPHDVIDGCARASRQDLPKKVQNYGMHFVGTAPGGDAIPRPRPTCPAARVRTHPAPTRPARARRHTHTAPAPPARPARARRHTHPAPAPPAHPARARRHTHTSQPVSVTSSVCSNCADRFPSTVTCSPRAHVSVCIPVCGLMHTRMPRARPICISECRGRAPAR